MARKGKYRSRLNWVVIILVSAVVAFCVLGTLQDKYGLELIDLKLPSLGQIGEYIGEITGEKQDTSVDTMDNALSVSGPAPGDGLTVHMLDMGQADSILIQAPGLTVLIDAGENNQGGQVLRYLKEQGVDRIDIAIGTHPHSDHIGGMDTVLEGIPVGKIILPDVPDEIVPTGATYTDLLAAIAEREVEVILAEPGQQYDLGDGALLTIVGPLAQYGDLNNMSVVSKLTYGEVAFLFAGDASAQSELALVDRGDIRADIMAVPHHGSSSSSTDVFLDAVSPSVALISCGLDNSYGHPHREVMERLQERDIEIYRTDLMGAITIVCDGVGVTISTER